MRVVNQIDRNALLRTIGKKKASDPEAQDGRIVVVHGAKGGSGTSVLAANLAACLAAHAGPVALVDLALTSADQDLLWNLDCPLRLDDVVGPEGHEVSDAMVAHPKGVRLLAGPLDPVQAEGVSPASIRPLLEELAERHPYVIVDTSTELSEVTVSALDAATRILLTVTPEMPSLRGTQRLLTVLERLGLESDNLELCLWTRTSEIDPAAVSRVLGRQVDWRLPWAPVVVQESVNTGKPVVLGQPRHILSTGIAALAAHIAGAAREGTAPLVAWRSKLAALVGTR